MPSFIYNIGLDKLIDEDTMNNFIGYIITTGNPIYGYYQYPYINKDVGNAQLIVRANQTDDKFTMSGFDVHVSGEHVWKVKVISDMKIENDDDVLSKRVLVKKVNDDGLAVINLVNADVLPSLLENEIIQCQVVAFADEINYYKNEKEFIKHNKIKYKNKYLSLADGLIVPVGVLLNDKISEEDKDLCVVKGIVKSPFYGELEINEYTENTFVRCVIDTEFGPTYLIHTLDQVDKSELKNIKVGSVVVATVRLSGDVAIYDYEKGIVKNEINHYKAIGYSLSRHKPDRLNSILEEDCEYHSLAANKFIKGKEAIIEYFTDVLNNINDTQYEVSNLTEDLEIKGNVFRKGMNCLLITYENQNKSILLIENNDQLNISKIYIVSVN